MLLHPHATTGMVCHERLPCRLVIRRFPNERRPQPATLSQTGPDFRLGLSCKCVPAEPVRTGIGLAKTVRPRRAPVEPAQASFLSRSLQDDPWILSSGPAACVKNRNREFLLSSLWPTTLYPKALMGPQRSQSQRRKPWLRKFLRLGAQWTKDLRSHQWRKRLAIRTTTLKTWRLHRLPRVKGRRQMTSLIHPPQVVGRLGTDNDLIRYSQNTTHAWLQPVASMSVLLDTSPKYGTFALAKGFSTWRTARA